MNETYCYFKVAGPQRAIGEVYGDIGYDVSGMLWAQEFKQLEAQGITEFDIHILSYGGSIFESMAMFTAMVNSKATVTTYNDGIAASCAGWLLFGGSKWVMKDYALLMMHNPWSVDNTSKGMEVLELWKNSIVTIISKRTGMDAQKVSDSMDEETWLDAPGCLALGLTTAIESTELLAKTDLKNMGKREVYNFASTQKASKSMEDNQEKAPETIPSEETIPAVTTDASATNPGDAPDATEGAKEPEADKAPEPQKSTQEIALELQNAELQNSLTDLQGRFAALETSLAGYVEAENKAKLDAKELEVKNLVDAAVDAGKVSEDFRDKWTNLAKADFDLAKSHLDTMPSLTHKKAKNLLADVSRNAETAHADIPSYRNMMTSDPAELNRIFNQNKGLFRAMWKKEYGTEYHD